MSHKLTIYVEGGAKGQLNRTVKEHFSSFFNKIASFENNRPAVVPGGGRNDTFKDYLQAIIDGENALLLVDSEELVEALNQTGTPAEWKPWNHLFTREGDKHWEARHDESGIPLKQEDAHLMVITMESWILCDAETLANYYGNKFRANALPPTGKEIESISKAETNSILEKATKDTTKGEYSKGNHSFALIGRIDPTLVEQKSPWAKRFLDEIRRRIAIAKK